MNRNKEIDMNCVENKNSIFKIIAPINTAAIAETELRCELEKKLNKNAEETMLFGAHATQKSMTSNEMCLLLLSKNSIKISCKPWEIPLQT